MLVKVVMVATASFALPSVELKLCRHCGGWEERLWNESQRKTVQIYPSEKRRATRGPVARECLALSVDMEPGWKGSCVVPL